MAAEPEAAGPAPGSFDLVSDPVETTLGAHGWATLIGCQALDLEPLDLAFRAKVGMQVERNPATRALGARMMRAITLAIAGLGEERLDGRPIAERQVAVGALRLQDVMYIAYTRLADEDAGRYTLYHDVEVCPHCEKKLAPEIEADLYTMRIRVHQATPRAVYRLRRPWRVRGLDVETVTLEPPRVSRAIEPMDEATWASGVMRQVFWVAASIVEINGKPRALSTDDLMTRETPTKTPRKAGISRADWEGLGAAFGAVSLGDVAMSVDWVHDVEDGGCGESIPVQVDLGTSFFGRSGA